MYWCGCVNSGNFFMIAFVFLCVCDHVSDHKNIAATCCVRISGRE